jgi:phosphatidylethanolamine N-methyltransferase
VTVLSLLSQFVLYYYLPSCIRGPVFLAYFAFWRGSYNIFLGWVLRRQSEKRWIMRKLREWGWLDVGDESEKPKNEGEAWARWWKKELEMKLGKEGYKWNEVPDEFNAWLMFRQLVDVILLK